MVTVRVHFDGHVLVPDEPVNLPKDRELVVDVREARAPADLAALMAQGAEFDPSSSDAEAFLTHVAAARVNAANVVRDEAVDRLGWPFLRSAAG